MDFGTKFGIAISVSAMGLAIFALFSPYEWSKSPVLVRRVFMAIGTLLFIGGIPLYFLLPSKEFPLVVIKFLDKTNTVFQIMNKSNVGAQNIKWHIAMFNVDNHSDANPLPIPATNFDFLGPHQSNLPVNVFQTPLVKPLIKEGDRLVGSASVVCPDCTRGFTYWVYVEWGHGGWYAEIPDMTEGVPVFPAKRVDNEVWVNYVMQQVPIAKRISIENRD